MKIIYFSSKLNQNGISRYHSLFATIIHLLSIHPIHKKSDFYAQYILDILILFITKLKGYFGLSYNPESHFNLFLV
jgi:hypothetical protein